MTTLTLTTPAFAPEDWIPDRHSGFGEDFTSEHLLKGAM